MPAIYCFRWNTRASTQLHKFAVIVVTGDVDPGQAQQLSTSVHSTCISERAPERPLHLSAT